MAQSSITSNAYVCYSSRKRVNDALGVMQEQEVPTELKGIAPEDQQDRHYL